MPTEQHEVNNPGILTSPIFHEVYWPKHPQNEVRVLGIIAQTLQVSEAWLTELQDDLLCPSLPHSDLLVETPRKAAVSEDVAHCLCRPSGLWIDRAQFKMLIPSGARQLEPWHSRDAFQLSPKGVAEVTKTNGGEGV